uniref:Secreted protein n=1 Tax=Ditylenchus dipsaci TaxID=166011 RepID=A0A915CPM8_9BILA
MTAISECIIVFLLISFAFEGESTGGGEGSSGKSTLNDRGNRQKVQVLCVEGRGKDLRVLLIPGQNKDGTPANTM